MLAKVRMLRWALPIALAAAGLKLVAHAVGVEPLDLNPLLSGLVAAEVFLLGFLLAGTNADFKEAERLPGDIAAGLDAMGDEFRIAALRGDADVSERGLAGLRGVAEALVDWLHGRAAFDDVIVSVEAVNPLILEVGTESARLKTEQAGLRRAVTRVQTIRQTSFVTAGYVIAEAIAVVVVVALLLTELGPGGEAAFFVAAVTLLLVYVNRLIRDLDNPFEYRSGRQGSADVSLAPLESLAERLTAPAEAAKRTSARFLTGATHT